MAKRKIFYGKATCLICHKPLVSANEYGTFCESQCELEESKKAMREVVTKFAFIGDEIRRK